MRNGVEFTKNNKSMDGRSNKDLAYSSKNKTLQVDTTKDPSHIGYIEELKATTPVTVTLDTWDDYFYEEQILFQIEHHLDFIPDYTCYFYVVDSPYPALIGNYVIDYYRPNAAEYIRAITDEKYFTIVYSVAVNGYGGGPPGPEYPYTYTVDMVSQMKLRVKYMIHPIESVGTLMYDH